MRLLTTFYSRHQFSEDDGPIFNFFYGEDALKSLRLPTYGVVGEAPGFDCTRIIGTGNYEIDKNKGGINIMLHNIKMNVIQTANNGIVDSATIFHFEQEANKVNARYSGGRIDHGYLVGQLNGKTLRFVYCQLRITGELDHGESECILSVQESGKLQLEENFRMETDGSTETGKNIFTEL
jgi:hypothetical protein